jgi:hypothetical protein
VKKLLFALTTFAFALAGAANTYKVTLFEPAMVSGAQLKPGEYKLEIRDNNKAVFTQGKQSAAEAPVKLENSPTKFASTSVKYDGSKLQEIRLGGTSTRLVFEN